MCYDLEYKALLGWQLNSIVIAGKSSVGATVW